MKSLLRLGRFLKRYRLSMALSLLMLAGTVATDLAIPRMTQTVIDRGILQRDMGAILRTTLAMVGVTAVGAGLFIANSLLAVQVSQGAAADLRRDLFTHIQSLSFANLDRLQTGQLMTRMTSDVMQILRLILLLMRMFVRAPLMIVGSVSLLLATNWQLALIMLVLMPAAMVVFWLFATKAQPMFLQVQRRLGQLNTVLQENLAGVRVVKAFVRARHESAGYDRKNVDLMEQAVAVGHLLAVLLPFLQLVTNLGTVAVVGLGGLQAIRGTLSVGQIVALNGYIMSIMFPLTHLGMMVGFISAAAASAKRVFEVLDTAPQIRERPDAYDLPLIKGRVVLEKVAFSYDGHDHQSVLTDIDLAAEPGEAVAILGATGAGKTTLINLIPRFYDASAGRVTIDGVDVRDVTLSSLRSQMGLVLQESVLFGGTIRDNIRYGRPEASEEEVVAAAKAAQAHDFIMRLPEGYDSWVGQRGVNLSGGEKQRLAIARALLMNPRILILDDSTSSVDVQTEIKIQRALERVMAGRTSFIVAQRVSTVLHADKIVVLDQGTITAIGTHSELMESSPIYREIYASQLGDDQKGRQNVSG